MYNILLQPFIPGPDRCFCSLFGIWIFWWRCAAVFSNGNLDFRQVTDGLLMVLGERQREAELEKTIKCNFMPRMCHKSDMFFSGIYARQLQVFRRYAEGWLIFDLCLGDNEIRFISDSCSILFPVSTLWFTLSTINLPHRKTATAWQHTIHILSGCSLYNM